MQGASWSMSPFRWIYAPSMSIPAGRSAVLPGELWMFSKGRIDEDREAKDNSVYKRDGG